MKRCWICNDVWMDILPSFERVELGLKMALLSDRFDFLVDEHFDGKSELTIWGPITIKMFKGPQAKVSTWIDNKWVNFPLPDRPLPNKIRFRELQIEYIDHSVIEFLRSNKHIWESRGTNLEFYVHSLENKRDIQPVWDVYTSEIWPIFSTTICQLGFVSADYLDNLRRLISPTILTDLDQLNAIGTSLRITDGIADDGPNANAGQALSKWLHTPAKNGQPKRLHYSDLSNSSRLKWVDDFKKTFICATDSSVSYKIRFNFLGPSNLLVPFELVNEQTNEKLTLMRKCEVNWLLKRCPISEKATAVQLKDDNDNLYDNYLSTVKFIFDCHVAPSG